MFLVLHKTFNFNTSLLNNWKKIHQRFVLCERQPLLTSEKLKMLQRNKIAIFFTSNFSLVILKTNDFNTCGLFFFINKK